MNWLLLSFDRNFRYLGKIIILELLVFEWFNTWGGDSSMNQSNVTPLVNCGGGTRLSGTARRLSSVLAPGSLISGAVTRSDHWPSDRIYPPYSPFGHPSSEVLTFRSCFRSKFIRYKMFRSLWAKKCAQFGPADVDRKNMRLDAPCVIFFLARRGKKAEEREIILL